MNRKEVDITELDEEDFHDGSHPESSESVSCNYVFGTINPIPSKPLNGTKKEMDTIRELLRTVCYSNTFWMIITKEKCNSKKKEGQIHYHWIIGLKKNAKRTLIIRIKSKLDEYFKVESEAEKRRTNDVQIPKLYKDVIGYIYKHRDIFEPETYDLPSHINIDNILKEWSLKHKSIGTHAFSRNPIERDGQFERHLISTIKDYMNKKNIMINRTSRKLRDMETGDHIPLDVFFENLERELGFMNYFTITGFNKLKQFILDPYIFVLPYFKPDLEYIGFSDGLYSLYRGIFTPRIEVKSEVVPFRIFKTSFTEEIKDIPIYWLKLLDKHDIELEDFLLYWKPLYQPRVHKFPIPVIIGPSNSGKTTIASVFKSLYKDNIAEVTEEGIFQYHDTATYEKLWLNDVDTTDPVHKTSHMLKLLAGESFPAAGKNKHNA